MGVKKNSDNAVEKDLHSPNCVKNYEGVGGGMETVAAVSIFNWSLEKRKVRYEYILGDGDSKAYQAVWDGNPYPDLKIKKAWVGVADVQKRMVSRLRYFKAQYKGLVLSDGKGLKGAGRLTDKVINEF